MNTTIEFKKAPIGAVALKGRRMAVKTWANNGSKTMWHVFGTKRYLGPYHSLYLHNEGYTIASMIHPGDDLDKVRAEAWDEGFTDGVNHDLGDWDNAPAIIKNPYREEKDA